MIALFSRIRAKVDVPALGLKAGARGVVVDRYSEPYLAYEVEFVDEDGDTIGCLSLRPEELEG